MVRRTSAQLCIRSIGTTTIISELVIAQSIVTHTITADVIASITQLASRSVTSVPGYTYQVAMTGIISFRTEAIARDTVPGTVAATRVDTVVDTVLVAG